MTRTGFVLFLILHSVLSLYGQRPTYEIDTLKEHYTDLQDYLFIFEETGEKIDTSNLPLQKIEGLLRPFREVHIDARPAVFWGRITFQNKTDSDLRDWVLETGEGNFVDVYLFDENGQQVAHERTGQWLPAKFKRLNQSNRKERVFLTLPRNSTRKVLLRVQASNYVPPNFRLKLSSEDYFKKWESRKGSVRDGFFLGFMCTMIFFNLLFFLTTKDKAYFYQFLFLVAVTVFMLESIGILADVPVLRNYPKTQLVIVYSSVFILNVAYIQFLRYYTDLNILSKKWDWLLRRLISINIIIWALLIPFFLITEAEVYCDRLIACLMAVQYTLLLALMLWLSRSGDRKNYFLVAACLAIIIGVFVNGIAILLNVGIQKESTQVILAVEVILFFLGLAYRMKTLQEEEQKALHLQEISEVKNRLYANITHEFRTPLTVINGMAEEVKDFPPVHADGKMKKAIGAIQHNGERLLLLVNRLLDLSKLESGKMTIDMKHGDVVSYLRFLVQSFDSFATSRKIHLQFLSDLAEFEMDFDADKIQQIVSNLLSNAIKFTPKNGKVYFSAKLEKATGQEVLSCQVQDTGRGIAPDELPKVFGRFYQAVGPKKKNEGTGVGLALAEELVKLMGGKIWAESELGKGSTFHFELPVRHEAKEKQTLPPVKPPASELTTTSIFPEKKQTKKRLEKTEERPQLLIVEDNSDVIYFLQSLLENQYDVDLAFDGEEGIEHAIETIPNLIICDVMMPKKDGFEVLATLKNDQRTSHIPIVMLTAKTSTDDRIAGLRQGADAYLTKPFQRDELFAILRNMIQMQERMQARYANGLPTTAGGAAVQAEDAFLVEIKKLLEANLDDEYFGIPQVCHTLRMSRTQLHRKLKALTGKSTSIFIRSIRLQRAKEMLARSPDLNISEVAYAVGFSDPSFFTKTFSEEFGVTPSQFRG